MKGTASETFINMKLMNDFGSLHPHLSVLSRSLSLTFQSFPEPCHPLISPFQKLAAHFKIHL
jgi:hypothetical protein